MEAHQTSTLPEALKIGAHTVRVVIADHWTGDEDAYGEYFKSEGVIYIRKGLPASVMFSTLVHEAMHVMNATIDHTLLDSLSEQVSQFLLDNNLVK